MYKYITESWKDLTFFTYFCSVFVSLDETCIATTPKFFYTTIDGMLSFQLSCWQPHHVSVDNDVPCQPN